MPWAQAGHAQGGSRHVCPRATVRRPAAIPLPFAALCTTAPGQANHVAAIHFCEGFASGAYQYYLALAARDPAERFVCLPEPTPSRDKIKADFVAWTKANPSVMGDPPVESIFRYLAQAYPCAPAKK
jgi:hypothetical protein